MAALSDRYDTVFRLAFDDPALADLEVRLRRSFGLLDSAGGMLDFDLDAVRTGHARPEDLGKLRALVDDFAGALVGWNLHRAPDGRLHAGTVEGGVPIGTDRHAVRGVGDALALALVGAYLSAVTVLVGADREQMEAERAAAEVDESVLPMQTMGG